MLLVPLIEWEQERKEKATFLYWTIVMEFQIQVMALVSCIRSKQFQLHVDLLDQELSKWTFIFDAINYLRFLSVYIVDMKNLDSEVKEQFDLGKWVVSKSARRWSSMALDQGHEQLNGVAKGPGGMVGLTENPVGFLRWMVVASERSKIVEEFRENIEISNESTESNKHHEEGFSQQEKFHKQVNDLANAIRELGNPFKDESKDLFKLDTREVMPDTSVETIRRMKELGTVQKNNFVKEVLVEKTKSIHATVKKNSLVIFNTKPKKVTARNVKAAVLKSDHNLFVRFFVATQNRKGDLKELFKFENRNSPIAFSDDGQFRDGDKSPLLALLSTFRKGLKPDVVDCVAVDAPVLVQGLNLAGISNFQELSVEFWKTVFKEIEKLNVHRADVIFDEYWDHSLKAGKRLKRGTGNRRQVRANTPVPKDYKSFLRVDANKKDLFAFLFQTGQQTLKPTGKTVFMTCKNQVGTIGSDDFIASLDCTHEEADTRIVVHVAAALQEKQIKTVSVRTADTDVVVILISKLQSFVSIKKKCSIWVDFGTGINRRWLPVNQMADTLGKEKAKALIAFHAFTGCDTTCFFFGIGKTKAWKAWESYPKVTDAFLWIVDHPFVKIKPKSRVMKILERFTILLYDVTSNETSVNVARWQMFCKRQKSYQNIPPTADSLFQHALRAQFQTGVWVLADRPKPVIPSAEGWGWAMSEKEQVYKPVWMTQPIASKACLTLTSCGCKTDCTTRRCSCNKTDPPLPCTDLCKCACREKK
eukprot:Lithocolla_globosa_v1_NODE_865_length_3166_cov_7.938966.p1 type:complete len:759 gc:universal NODE_865_length_3166_cov_7.938966:2838-562(-)